MTELPRTMRAVAMERFGGTGTLELRTLPVPTVGPGEVLVRVEWAGVGEWDPFEREGGYAEMLGLEPTFPYVLGSEGAGTVARVGEGVRGFTPGDPVYAVGFLNPRGGFYAEYAAVPADMVSPLPTGMTGREAAGLGGVGLTALRGLADVLEIRPGEAVMVFGASGGVGHVAVQLAKRMGARVLAVASGADGVALVRELGADHAVDGRRDDVPAAGRGFAPAGLDAALLTAGGEEAERALAALREGGRAAFPGGVQPAPRAPAGVRLHGYNGDPDGEIIRRLDALVERGPFRVNVAHTFPLERAADAHRALGRHYLGKLILHVGPGEPAPDGVPAAPAREEG